MNATIGGHALKRSIVLVGLMGSGKSSIGKRLAQHLTMKFADSDAKIEKTAKMYPNINPSAREPSIIIFTEALVNWTKIRST